MKYLFLLLFFLSIKNYSQTSSVIFVDSGPNKKFSNNDGVYSNHAFDNGVHGARYLLNSFDNNGVILGDNKNNFRIKNINIDLVDNEFVSEISEDSVFIHSNIKKISINDKLYEKKSGKIYRVILKGQKLSLFLLKSKVLKKEIIDKLSGKVIKPKRWELKETYYISEDNDKLVLVKLKRSSITNFFKNNDKKKVIDYSKRTKLKFNNLTDFIKIIHYYNSI